MTKRNYIICWVIFILVVLSEYVGAQNDIQSVQISILLTRLLKEVILVIRTIGYELGYVLSLIDTWKYITFLIEATYIWKHIIGIVLTVWGILDSVLSLLGSLVVETLIGISEYLRESSMTWHTVVIAFGILGYVGWRIFYKRLIKSSGSCLVIQAMLYGAIWVLLSMNELERLANALTIICLLGITFILPVVRMEEYHDNRWIYDIAVSSIFIVKGFLHPDKSCGGGAILAFFCKVILLSVAYSPQTDVKPHID